MSPSGLSAEQTGLANLDRCQREPLATQALDYLQTAAGRAAIYGPDPPPPHYVPVVPPASIRHDYYHDHDRDHYSYARPAWEVPHRAYLNPYHDAYFRRFRPGYRPIVVGTTQYYGYPSLPPYAQSVVV